MQQMWIYRKNRQFVVEHVEPHLQPPTHGSHDRVYVSWEDCKY